jgi:rhamnose utilization protein RhaD (predicted bifunctional aldolase and dehydrogenase)/NAD(P)-dependent dehydrogenase (short-subunit alcohol dehydrogenase family)
MLSRWEDAEARETVRRYGERGIAEDVALRLYTTRLLGCDPLLVLHGGGNTSVKTVGRDLLGARVRVLRVKGSGWDMAAIEPAGLPAVRLEPLLALRGLDVLSDEDMVGYQRGNLLDAQAPNPSVETLLHAFLPHAFVDHTHSAAVLSLTDQEDDERLLEEVYGERVCLVPYVKPGFALAKAAADAFDSRPAVEGLILRKHGIFTFGADAREAYERMIALVTLAEARLARGRRSVFAAATLPRERAAVADVAPLLRGLVAHRPDGADSHPRMLVLEHRTSDAIRGYVDGADLAGYARRGVVTPDHVIRTKPRPLVLPAPEAGRLDAFAAAAREAVEAYQAEYRAYFARHDGVREAPKRPLDPMPRVALVPGVGLFGMGRSAGDARIAADLAENTVRVVTDAETVGSFAPLGEAELFDMEYWSLEQAKLAKAAEKRLAGQVALVTGGGGGIGAATAARFAAEGAAVAVLDRDEAGARRAAEACGAGALAFGCDVTDPVAVRAAFDAVCTAFGGVDVLVSNAGAAWQGRIGEVPDTVLRESFDLNFFAHQTVAKNAVRVMVAQGTGGVLLFNVSKQAVNPGPDFGPYGLPKAATLFLMKQYAVDYGRAGIRSNAVNADRVRTGIFDGGVLEARARARGVGVDAYLRDGNLLRREVTVDDVAEAFLSLALARATTAATLTVDGGNVAAAMR